MATVKCSTTSPAMNKATDIADWLATVPPTSVIGVATGSRYHVEDLEDDAGNARLLFVATWEEVR